MHLIMRIIKKLFQSISNYFTARVKGKSRIIGDCQLIMRFVILNVILTNSRQQICPRILIMT